MSEDFAHRNGTTRPSGEGGANRTREKAAGSERRPAGAWELCEEFAPRNGRTRLSGEGEQTAPGKKRPAASGTRRGRGNCVKILLHMTEEQGLAGRGGANRAREKAAGTQRWRGNCVKNLLPQTKEQGLAGRVGANCARKKAAGTRRGRGNCVKNLLPQTEEQGLAGRGEQTAPGPPHPAGIKSKGSGFRRCAESTPFIVCQAWRKSYG